jgi:hypothetical protein
VTHTQSIVTKGRLFIKNSYTELHENPTSALVADTTSQTGRPTSAPSHTRNQIFDKRRNMSPHIRQSRPRITNLPTKKEKNSFNFACVRHFVPLYCVRHFVKQALRHYVFTMISTHSNPVIKPYFTRFLRAHIPRFSVAFLLVLTEHKL